MECVLQAHFGSKRCNHSYLCARFKDRWDHMRRVPRGAERHTKNNGGVKRGLGGQNLKRESRTHDYSESPNKTSYKDGEGVKREEKQGYLGWIKEVEKGK